LDPAAIHGYHIHIMRIIFVFITNIWGYINCLGIREISLRSNYIFIVKIYVEGLRGPNGPQLSRRRLTNNGVGVN
jgi:hypothetical protein